MTHTDPNQYNANLGELVTPRIRTVVYIITAVGGLLTFLLAGLAPIWFDADTAKRIVDTATVVTGALALLGGSVGILYRPTR